MSANCWRRVRYGIGFAVFMIALAAEAMAQPVNMIWQRDGRTAHSFMGANIFGLGDQNQDGYADFAVYAPGDSWQGGLDSGVVELFHGGNPPDTVPSHTFRPADEGMLNFNWAQPVGDLNGDGFQDYEIEYLHDVSARWIVPIRPSAGYYRADPGGGTQSSQRLLHPPGLHGSVSAGPGTPLVCLPQRQV